MTHLTPFSSDIFESADTLRAYLTGQEAISQIHQMARSPISPAGAKLNGKWEVVKWELYALAQELFSIFLTAVSNLLHCIGATNLSKRCYVASRQAMAPTFFLRHYYQMGDNFLMSSLNAHRSDTADIYLHPPLAPGSAFEMDEKGVEFFHPKGICRGMVKWFSYLYFHTQDHFSDPDEHVKAVTQQFESGAPKEASLLQGLHEEAASQLLDLDQELNVLQCDPLHQTDRQIAEQLCALDPGVYVLYSSSHCVNWIRLNDGQGYFYDPTCGLDRILSAADLALCVREFSKTHTVTAAMPQLVCDRVSCRRGD